MTGRIIETPELSAILAVVDYWLDSEVAEQYRQQPLAQDWARVGKVIEELGEAVSALIGYTGQNPRKGVTSSRDEMLVELADVAATALFAIQHFTRDTAETLIVFSDKLRAIRQRVPSPFEQRAADALTGDDRHEVLPHERVS